MKKKILCILVCMLLLATIPLAAGMSFDNETEDETTGLVGWAWLRGWVLNPKVVGNKVHARALRLHYIEVSGTETNIGIVRFKQVEFRDGSPLGIRMEFGLLGSMSYVFGLFHGGLDIKD